MPRYSTHLSAFVSRATSDASRFYWVILTADGYVCRQGYCDTLVQARSNAWREIALLIRERNA